LTINATKKYSVLINKVLALKVRAQMENLPYAQRS